MALVQQTSIDSYNIVKQTTRQTVQQKLLDILLSRGKATNRHRYAVLEFSVVMTRPTRNAKNEMNIKTALIDFSLFQQVFLNNIRLTMNVVTKNEAITFVC